MIAYLKGILLTKSPQYIVLDINGVGYEILIPLSTFYSLPQENGEVSLNIYTHVREDTLSLFGFSSSLEKDIFRLLISVSGIGPKLAINILSGIGPQELIAAISRGDALCLQSIPGVGRKTAERMALELKEKALGISGDLELPPTQVLDEKDKKVLDDALSALLNLGYQKKAAKTAVEKAMKGLAEVNLEGVIKEALKLLS
jgi:Holliday junction DNA helicase RuvA